MKKDIKLNFSSFWNGFDHNDNYFLKILEPYYNIIPSTNPDFVLYADNGYDYLNYKCIRIYFTGENHRPNFNECDFAFSFEKTNARNHRLPLYAVTRTIQQLYDAQNELNNTINIPRKFCCILSSNPKATTRYAFANTLSHYKPIDSGGKINNNMGYMVADKHIFLLNYTFNICFENEKNIGYTTEKLFDALAANCIPIYWGNPHTYIDFNPQAFILGNDFKTHKKLSDYIIEIDNNPALKNHILHQPKLNDNKYCHSAQPEIVLQQFEKIFAQKNKITPVATTWRAKYTELQRKYTLLTRIKNKITYQTTKIMQPFAQEL
jgi:hypothetical protein